MFNSDMAYFIKHRKSGFCLVTRENNVYRKEKEIRKYGIYWI